MTDKEFQLLKDDVQGIGSVDLLRKVYRAVNGKLTSKQKQVYVDACKKRKKELIAK